MSQVSVTGGSEKKIEIGYLPAVAFKTRTKTELKIFYSPATLLESSLSGWWGVGGTVLRDFILDYSKECLD